MNIASSTNTSPIAITVSGTLPTDFLTGCLVDVAEHQSNTSANGEYVATVTGASTFTIPVAGVGVGGATGTVQPRNLNPFYAVPSDGDNDNSASITPWADATGDRTQWLASRVGQYRLARIEGIEYTDLTGAPWCTISAAGVVAGVAKQFVAQLVAWGTLVGSALHTPVGGQAPYFGISGVNSGDLIRARLDTTFKADSTNGGRLALYGTVINPNTVIPVWPGDYAVIPGASKGIRLTGASVETPISVVAMFSAAVTGNLWLQPVFVPYNTETDSLSLVGDTLLSIEIWRPTGMPQ